MVYPTDYHGGGKGELARGEEIARWTVDQKPIELVLVLHRRRGGTKELVRIALCHISGSHKSCADIVL